MINVPIVVTLDAYTQYDSVGGLLTSERVKELKGGGYIAALKGKPDKTQFTVTPANRDALPSRILELLKN